MKIVRALFGNNLKNHFIKEIPTSPKYDEIVYVWGIDNLKYLESLGYQTRYMSDDTNVDYKYKLIALDLSYEEFGEILFLDWDVGTNLSLEQISSLELSSPCMPLYSYPKEYNHNNFMLNQQIKIYSWDLEDSYVIPNACFIYTKDFNLGKELLKIHHIFNFETLVEEFAFQVFCGNTLDEYIKRYDVPYLNGRGDEQIFKQDDKVWNTAKKLNTYIGEKKILFDHG